MTDHGQTFTLITNSKFDEDGRSQSRYTGIYCFILNGDTPFGRCLFRNFPILSFFNIAVIFFFKKSDLICELSSMILHNLVPRDAGKEVVKKKTANAQRIVTSKTFFAVAHLNRL